VADNILFDNILITDEKRVAEDWSDQTWVIKYEQELAGVASAVCSFVPLSGCLYSSAWHGVY